MRKLHVARGEESADWSDVILRVQSVLDAISRNTFVRRVDTIIAGGDPVLWAIALSRIAQAKPGARVAIALTHDFQGAPLAAIHDNGFRARMRASGINLPDADKLDRFFEDRAAEFFEAGGRLLCLADQLRIFDDKGGVMGVVDRSDEGPRLPIGFAREKFGLSIESASDKGRAEIFAARSEMMFHRTKGAFRVCFMSNAKALPAGKRYGDVVLASSLILATRAQGHVSVQDLIGSDKIQLMNFCVSQSASISQAVEAWGCDLEVIGRSLAK